MKTNTFVQALNVVPSSVVGVDRVVVVTLGFTDPEAAQKAGFAPQTMIQATVLDASKFTPGSEHEVNIL